jgi:hypothetical protein
MNSIFNEDFLEYLSLLNKHEVEYILVGGLAVNLYGYRRATGDMDLWISPTKENHLKLTHVHYDYNMPMGDMEYLNNFLDTETYDVFQFGGGYFHIDVMTKCKGLTFEDTYKQSTWVDVENTPVRLVHINHLIQAKKASGRFKDLDDIENLGKV